MRVKTSVTLPQALLGRLDLIDNNRSAIIERAATAYVAQIEAAERDRLDIAIINKNAKRLNQEAADTLEYQQIP